MLPSRHSKFNRFIFTSMQNPKPRILLVDDDPTNLLLLEELLLSEGYFPLLAASGSEALKTLPSQVLT
jgi:CheY-like chemotaxis protein